MTVTDTAKGQEHTLRRDLVTKLATVAHNISRHIINGGVIDIDKGVSTAILETGSRDKFLVVSFGPTNDRLWELPVSINILDAMASLADDNKTIAAA